MSNENIVNCKVADLVEYYNLTLSLFNIVKHVKSDSRTYIKYLEL
jgi:hypothetical protein